MTNNLHSEPRPRNENREMCRSLNESKICIESRISWRLYLSIHIFLFIRGSLFWSVWRVRLTASFGKCNDAWSLNSFIVEHTLEAGTGQQIYSNSPDTLTFLRDSNYAQNGNSEQQSD